MPFYAGGRGNRLPFIIAGGGGRGAAIAEVVFQPCECRHGDPINGLKPEYCASMRAMSGSFVIPSVGVYRADNNLESQSSKCHLVLVPGVCPYPSLQDEGATIDEVYISSERAGSLMKMKFAAILLINPGLNSRNPHAKSLDADS